ncbi:YqaJ viral recombinase family protein [Caballeronia sp. LZ065]|uniref:lambda exonuclease family protein n=1 Tax=Caballeronia sp. LZ065 TaxID=3038571 RepID=UPI002859541D|nr:YqaJ viral recombinase family protein [Caballeronia sp. LZ065]MDR5784097.1 YqaJ viral recombinase family protein [Caballeronia sp. LZ065]
MSDVIEQRTDAWREARAGKLTASRFIDAIAMSKVEPGDMYKSGPRKGQPKIAESLAPREKYKREVAFERLAGMPRHEISGHALRYGSEVEQFAREAYELHTGNIAVEAQFVCHPDYDFIGASPDFLVDSDGGGEMKCPMDEGVHIGTWLEGVPLDHIPQIQGGMLVTGRQWWDFVSYDPRQCDRLRLYVQRIPRDDDYINGILLPGLLQFNAEVEQMIAELNRRAA